MRSKLLTVGLVLVGVIGIGVAVALFAARSSQSLPPAQAPVVENSNSHPSPETGHVAPPSHETATLSETQFTAVTNTLPLMQATNPADLANSANTNTWDEKIDDIVGSDDPDTNKVAKLFALFPSLPPDGQEEVAQHLSNLVDDEDYKPLGDMLKNDKLPEGVLDELLADVLNRPNNLKLPLLLAVASDANHAKHDEAKDLLELYLGEDYGSDWNSWGTHMTNWMQQNPE